MAANFEDDPEFHGTGPKPKPRRGPRLGAIFGVLAIILVGIALLLPAVRGPGTAIRRQMQCRKNLKQIGLALHNYEQAYHALPPAFTVDALGRPLHSWRTLILPYLDNVELYETIDLTKPWNDPANAEALETRLSVFECPEAMGSQKTMTSYLATPGCLVAGVPRPLSEITDDHQATLMVIEVFSKPAIPWMAPVDADEALVMGLGPKVKLDHVRGMHACFVDGSVQFLYADMAADVRRGLLTIGGNEQMDRDAY